jgi:Fuseless
MAFLRGKNFNFRSLLAACCDVNLFAQFAARWHGWRRLVVDDVVTFMQFVSEAFLWRGAWNLNTKFVITDPFLGGWVNHAIGTFLLMSLQIFSYVGTVGCSLDVPDETGRLILA